MTVGRWPVTLLFLVLAAAPDTRAQVTSGAVMRQEPPLPAGQRITAADGDTVLIEGDARVRIVRRRPAFVRMVANNDQRYVILLTENLREYGDSPRRVAERSYAFTGLREPWPLAPRWEGAVWLEEYFPAGSHSWIGSTLGLETPDGKVVFGNRDSELAATEDARTVVIRFQGMSGGGGQQPFDQEEVRVLALAAENAVSGVARWQTLPGGMNGGPGSGGIGFTSETFTSSTSEISPPPLLMGGVRARDIATAPRKIHDVAPVMPETARIAGARGTVFLEVTIAADGSVSSARVLRSIPLLDQAAIDAVRQWRYEPLKMDGQPVPVVLTVDVPFPPPPQ